MKFLVKCLGFDHSHNSWLPWTSTNELAAMDTYEQNNPDVQFPATKTYNMFEVNNTGQFHMKTYNTTNTIYPTIDKSSALIPHSVVQAQQSVLAKYWTEAQQLEIKSHLDNSAWILPTIPIHTIPKHKNIPTKFKYDIVYNPDDTLKKFKARPLLRGDLWRGEANDTYAPTVDMDIIKLLLAIAAEEDYELESLDIKSAFQTAPLLQMKRSILKDPKDSQIRTCLR